MPFKYNVHVLSKTEGLDVTLWVGIILDNKCDPDSNICADDSELGKAAIARAHEICPALKDCMCEEWNGGQAIAPVISVKPFFPPSYKADILELGNLFRPFANRMVELGYRLALDVDGEFLPTILPRNAACCSAGSYSHEKAIALSTPREVLESSTELIDRGDLFTLVDHKPFMSLVDEAEG